MTPDNTATAAHAPPPPTTAGSQTGTPPSGQSGNAAKAPECMAHGNEKKPASRTATMTLKGVVEHSGRRKRDRSSQ